jgi:hypothetical protein
VSFLVLLACSASQNASGQAFINLNFEQSTIVSSSPTSFGFSSGIANVPGWTEYNIMVGRIVIIRADQPWFITTRH